MSRKRPQNVAAMDRNFPEAIWCVAEEEAEEYGGRLERSRVLAHPDVVVGIGRTRQWILDNVPGDIFILDDDISHVWSNVGQTGRRIVGHENIAQVIENAAEIARVAGAPVFGFNQAWDVRKFSPFDPFSFSGWIGTAIGFIGRDIRYDENLKTQADVDFCLRALLERRKVFIDKRFAFACQRFNNSGGSAGVRDFGTYKAQVTTVCERWRGWASLADAKTTIRLKIDVPRRQPLDIE